MTDDKKTINLNLRAGDGGADASARSMSRMMWADRVPRVVDPAPHVRRRQLMRDVLDDLGRALMIGLTLGVAVGVTAALLATAIAKAMGWW